MKAVQPALVSKTLHSYIRDASGFHYWICPIPNNLIYCNSYVTPHMNISYDILSTFCKHCSNIYNAIY